MRVPDLSARGATSSRSSSRSSAPASGTGCPGRTADRLPIRADRGGTSTSWRGSTTRWPTYYAEKVASDRRRDGGRRARVAGARNPRVDRGQPDHRAGDARAVARGRRARPDAPQPGDPGADRRLSGPAGGAARGDRVTSLPTTGWSSRSRTAMRHGCRDTSSRRSSGETMGRDETATRAAGRRQRSPARPGVGPRQT